MKHDKLKTLRNTIHITNEYNRVAAPILERVKELSKQFIGKKIVTLKGLSAKYTNVVSLPMEERDAIKVKPIEGTKWARVNSVYVREAYKSMIVEIKVSFSDGNSGGYTEDRAFYFGKTDEAGVLLEVDDTCKVPTTVLDFNDELSKIKVFLAFKKKANEAEEVINVSRENYKYLEFEELD